MRKRVFVFVDGFNLYHAIKNLKDKKLLWLDLKTLSEHFINPLYEEIDKVYYFSAIATHMDKEKQNRHRAYIKALETTGVEFIQGEFKKKHGNICKNVRELYTIPTPLEIPNIVYEEKETDVSIALQMLYDSMKRNCDKIILISNDTDMRPALKMARLENPELETEVLTPPTYMANNTLLLQANQKKPRKIKRKQIENSLLPELIIHEGRSVNIPKKYKG